MNYTGVTQVLKVPRQSRSYKTKHLADDLRRVELIELAGPFDVVDEISLFTPFSEMLSLLCPPEQVNRPFWCPFPNARPCCVK